MYIKKIAIMKFTTPVPITNSNHPIDYNSKIVSLGSCFAVNIGQKLDYFKFQNTTNPFGIIFNPVSIEKLVVRAVHQKLFTEADIFFYNERFHSYEVHSDLSATNKKEFLDHLNETIQLMHEQLKEASHILITYGTSWVYSDTTNNTIVANCHKMPQSHFDKHILSVAAIEVAIQNTVDAIRQLNSNCSFVFTISPVRHIKDGFIENQRSKSHLITALHNLLSGYQLGVASYFPGYEIMMDELRDYRFYGNDLLHPSEMAVDYIWQRFKETTISPTTFSTLDQIASIQKGLEHRPFNTDAKSYQEFQSKLADKIKKLKEEYPFMHF